MRPSAPPMHTRMLSFLSDIEKALAADDPSPMDGSWETSRIINYHLGLARLTLAVKDPTGKKHERGVILLQSYQLADGTPCLKAALSWTASAGSMVRAIYAKPDVNWTSEARRVAAEWMGGPPPVPAVPVQQDTPNDLHPGVAAAV